MPSSSVVKDVALPKGCFMSCWLSSLIVLGSSGSAIAPFSKTTRPADVFPTSPVPAGTILPEIVRSSTLAVISAENVRMFVIRFLHFR